MLKKHREILLFVAIFLGSYLVLTLIYHFYLQYWLTKTPTEPDWLTKQVAYHAQFISELIGYPFTLENMNDEPSYFMKFNNIVTARMLEGCNGISVIILFNSFIASFYKTLKSTILYMILGSVLLYFINLLRIASINVLLFKFPEYQSFLHDVLFPGIVYGSVMILWLFWIKSFAKNG